MRKIPVLALSRINDKPGERYHAGDPLHSTHLRDTDMHKGTFPKQGLEEAEQTYSPGSWTPEELEDPARSGYSRRQWMFGVCGIALCSVAAGAALSRSWISGAAPAEASESAQELRLGSLEWALDLLNQPPEVLIIQSGNLERVSGRYRNDARLVPVFERLMDVVLDARGENVDMAGAIAVRSLNRLGNMDSVAVRERRIRGRADLVETRQAMEWVLADLEDSQGK